MQIEKIQRHGGGGGGSWRLSLGCLGHGGSWLGGFRERERERERETERGIKHRYLSLA